MTKRIDLTLPGLNWAVPVGISFFTFQSLSYVVDVYKSKITVEKNFLDYALFVSFFPQIVCGPISKASELLPQIKEEKKFNYHSCISGLKYFLLGMFFKMCLADRAGLYVDAVYNDVDKFCGIGCSVAMILYSIQIYADFAGYSFMAIGAAKLFGFNLVNNFVRPYFSISVTEFWRRWHISLSRWLKDYIYIPLGGSHCRKLRSYYNILITFMVSGLWHGANWTFIIWGIIHGAVQVVEKMLGINQSQVRNSIQRVIRVLCTFVIVTIAWVFFRADSISGAWNILCGLGRIDGTLLADAASLSMVILSLIPVLIYEWLSEFRPFILQKIMSHRLILWSVYLFLLCMIILFGVDGGSFIYANF